MLGICCLFESMFRLLFRPILAMSLLAPALAGPERRPDILFLFADDFAAEALSAVFPGYCHTPHLDALAERGVLIPDAINPGSWHGAVCVASRAMLLSGHSLDRSQAEDTVPQWDSLAAQGQLLPQRLAAVGYRTAFVGKWHNPSDTRDQLVARCFDRHGTIRPGMPATPPSLYLAAGAGSYYGRPHADGTEDWRPDDPNLGGHWEGGRHWSEVAADEAIEILQAEPQASSPLFLMVAFNAPHDPRQAPREFLERHPVAEIPLPRAYAAEFTGPPAILRIRDERLGPYPHSEESVRLHRAEYAAIVEHLDAQIGRILDALEDSGRLDHTLVAFSADHGLALGNHGLLGKQNLYLHSASAPLILAGPRIPAAREIRNSLACIQDLHPTFLVAAGAELPDDLGFLPLQALIEGRQRRQREFIQTRFADLLSGYREGDWQLIWNRHLSAEIPGALELYDLAADPDQRTNLAGREDQAGRIERMLSQLSGR